MVKIVDKIKHSLQYSNHIPNAPFHLEHLFKMEHPVSISKKTNYFQLASN